MFGGHPDIFGSRNGPVRTALRGRPHAGFLYPTHVTLIETPLKQNIAILCRQGVSRGVGASIALEGRRHAAKKGKKLQRSICKWRQCRLRAYLARALKAELGT